MKTTFLENYQVFLWEILRLAGRMNLECFFKTTRLGSHKLVIFMRTWSNGLSSFLKNLPKTILP